MRSQLLLLATALAYTFGQDSNEDQTFSVLTVIKPDGLKDLYNATDGKIANGPAMWGKPVNGYKDNIQGKVVYAPADNLEGCKPFNMEEMVIPKEGIVAIDRGACDFVVKAIHAQWIGAAAVIIVNNKDGPIPMMNKDRNGNHTKVTIPAIMIHKTDGAHLKTFLEDGYSLTLDLHWEFPKKDVVEWEFWSGAEDPYAGQFKAVFDDVIAMLGDHSKMRPYTVIGLEEGDSMKDGSNCIPDPPTAELPCGSKCTNNGRYCRQWAHGDEEVRENLRSVCLYKHLDKTGKEEDHLRWWAYLDLFHRNCGHLVDTQHPELADGIQACSENMMLNPDVDVDPTAIQNCITLAGGYGDRDGPNSILEEEIEEKNRLGVKYQPTIIINGVHYWGSVDCPQPITLPTCGPLAAICRGFTNRSAVPVCADGLEVPMRTLNPTAGPTARPTVMPTRSPIPTPPPTTFVEEVSPGAPPLWGRPDYALGAMLSSMAIAHVVTRSFCVFWDRYVFGM